ncbi:MAG: glycosyltransferase family 4 protein, partial [Sedimentisphaerales bacterium]|nr:glycosyltransferase family 4 protein [Sedimentisphaerales bacterium]
MRVALCAALDLNTAGGVELHVLQLARALRQLGLQVDIFGNTYGLDIYSLEQLRPEKYHIIHTHAGALSPHFINWSLSRCHFNRHIHTLHGVSLDYLINCHAWFNWRCYWGTLVEGYLARHADHVITVSQSIKNRARQCFNLTEDKISVIYNGYLPPPQTPAANRQQIRERFGLASDDIVLLFIGRSHDIVKGADTVTTALHTLYPQYPNLRLMAIPGDGFPDAPWLRRTGPVPHPDITNYYAAADIFINASLNEGMPLTVIEAMAAGLPVIAAPTGGIPETITHNQTGLLLNKNRTNLPDLITRLIQNPNLKIKLIQNAQKT